MTYVGLRHAYVICRTLASLYYDKNKLSKLQPKFTKVSTESEWSLILANANNNKKAVLSQRWPLYAR